MTHAPASQIGGHPSSTDSQRAVIRLIAAGTATSKADLVRATGLARSTVTEHLNRLRTAEIVGDGERSASTVRGRPPQNLRINGAAGMVLGADVRRNRSTLALADINGRVIDQRNIECSLAQGPVGALDAISEQFEAMLDNARVPRNHVRALAMGIPSPVDVVEGRPIHPPLMPGWDRYPVADTLAERFSTRVVLDNDVNVMAVGETTASATAKTPLLFLHISDGIGCGIVTSHGELLRGADGAAGDVATSALTGTTTPFAVAATSDASNRWRPPQRLRNAFAKGRPINGYSLKTTSFS